MAFPFLFESDADDSADDGDADDADDDAEKTIYSI